MPPKKVHVNGSVNFANTESVMRQLAKRVPCLERIPDGERGERESWLEFQEERFLGARGLERAWTRPSIGELDMAKVSLLPGTDPMTVQWPDIGYTNAYRDSYKIFRRLMDAGVIGSAVRLQVNVATPLAAVSTYVAEGALLVEPAYAKALSADLKQLFDEIPHEHLAIQWDCPVEVGVVEMPEAFAVSGTQDFQSAVASLVRCVEMIPGTVPTGLHLCYGDYQHRHWKEPDSLKVQVDLINGALDALNRDLNWCSMTVPQEVIHPEYFSPLTRWRHEAPDLYLGIVPYHPSRQRPGTLEEQVRLIDEALGDRPWGISTECGLSNVDREELPLLLDLHSDLLSRWDGRPG